VDRNKRRGIGTSVAQQREELRTLEVHQIITPMISMAMIRSQAGGGAVCIDGRARPITLHGLQGQSMQSLGMVA
jgi:hypothetical protein